jgi:hypothetical protein
MTTSRGSRHDTGSSSIGAGLDRRHALRLLAGSAGVAASAAWLDELTLLAEQHALHATAAATASPQAGPVFTPKVLNAHQFQTVGVLVELMIPATETPGARAALVDRIVDSALEAATESSRTQFLSGLGWLDARSRALFAQDFVAATAVQQTDLLTRLSNSVDSTSPAEVPAGVEFFMAIKSMTITGYYSTEIGLRQELGDPGVLMSATFEGCTHPEHQG